MKYIKTFEQTFEQQRYELSELNVGDYIETWSGLPGEVTSINNDGTYTIVVKQRWLDRNLVEDIDIPIDLLFVNIKRKMSKEEFEDWQISLDAKKYNL